MDFWKAILGLVRRRSLGLPLLAVALGLAAAAFFLMPARYVSSATMVLTTPTGGGTLSQDPARPTGLTNPLLNFDEGLRTAATILIQAVNTPQTMEALGVDGGGATKVVIDDGRSNLALLGSNGPFIYIQSSSSTPEAARDVVVRAQDLVRAELDNRQKALGAPPTTFIKVVEVVPPAGAEGQNGARYQAAGAAFVLAFGLGLTGAYIAMRLRQRRAEEDAGDSPSGPDDEPDDPGVGAAPPLEQDEVVTNGSPVSGAHDGRGAVTIGGGSSGGQGT